MSVSVRRLALIASAVVVFMDIFDAYASKATGIPYASFGWLSIVVYLAIGFLAFRATRSIPNAVLVAFVAAIAEATIGWYISSVIGPGKPVNRDAYSIVAGGILGTTFQTAVGWIGALVGRVVLRPRN